MVSTFRGLALAGLLALAAGGASASTTVAFSHPENYLDMPFAAFDREQVLRELADHFEKLGATLPPGQDLHIEVVELDLAGWLRPNFRGQDLRILNGSADWPHMLVRYRLEMGGKVLYSGEDKLDDMLYMNRLNRYSDGDPLRYEKRMIDDWFMHKFTPGRRAR